MTKPNIPSMLKSWRDQGCKVLQRRGMKDLEELEWSRTPQEHGPENGLTRTQVGSQRWGSSVWVWLRSSAFMIWLCSLGFLWDFYQWEWELSLFCLTLGLFFSYWLALSSLDVRICVWSYCSFLCQILLFSLEGLLFSQKET